MPMRSFRKFSGVSPSARMASTASIVVWALAHAA
jgi:hypothetical protein